MHACNAILPLDFGIIPVRLSFGGCTATKAKVQPRRIDILSPLHIEEACEARIGL